MSHIFISYAREDQPWAEMLAQTLEGRAPRSFTSAVAFSAAPFSSMASISRSRSEPVHTISRKYARFTRPLVE